MRTYLNILNFCRLVMIVAVFLCVTDVHAGTIFVDDDRINDPDLEDGSSEHPFDTIQEGIDAAVDGDEIVVRPGIYTGNGNRDLDYSHGLPDGQTRSITVRSIDPNDPEVVAATVIDCGGTEEEPHRGFYFHSGEGANSVLAGLTITGGYGPFETVSWSSNLHSVGGGVFLRGSCTPTFQKCTLTGNVAEYGGGMFAFDYAGATLESCIFTDNVASSKGGGVGIHHARSVSFENCIIAENQSTNGGGVLIYSSATVTFARCTILENCVTNCGGGISCDWTNVNMSACLIGANYALYNGGGCWVMWTDFNIVNSVIVGNYAGHRGGGVEGHCLGSPILTNCTLTSNTATYGGAISSDHAGSPHIHNCILWDNDAEYGPEVSITGTSNRSWFFCTHSILQGRQANIYMDDNPDHRLEWGEGMIDAPPLFLRPPYDGGDGWGDDPNTPGIDEGSNDDFGDLRLQAYSAAIDVGDNSALPIDEFDLDNDGDQDEALPYDMNDYYRIVNAIVDIGAYEYGSPLVCKIENKIYRDTCPITWKLYGSECQQADTLMAEYSIDDAQSWHSIPGAGSVPVTDQYYLWDVSSMPDGTNYRVRLTCNQDPNIFASSEDIFEIDQPVFYYVNDNSIEGDVYCTVPGDDAQDGLTPETPKASVQNVIDEYALEPCDVVYIDTGTYVQSENIVIAPEDSGDPSGQVRFIGSYHSTGSLIDRNNTADHSYGIHIDNSDYVALENLTITGAGRGVYIQNASYSAVQSCRIYGNSRHGLMLHSSKCGGIQNSLVYNNGNAGIYLLYSQYAGLQNNLVYNNGYNGISIGSYSDFAKIVSNTVCWNDNRQIKLASSSNQVLLHNNIVWAEGSGVCCVEGWSREPIVASNYNNFYTTHDAYVASYDDSLYSTLLDWQYSTGFDEQSISSDPVFVDPYGIDGILGTEDDDWHLQSTRGSWHNGSWLTDGYDSPCIDAGNPADDMRDEPIPNGSRINLGAYGGTNQASKASI